MRGAAQRLERASATAKQGLRFAGRLPVVAGMIAGIVVAVLVIALTRGHFELERLDLDKPDPGISPLPPWRQPPVVAPPRPIPEWQYQSVAPIIVKPKLVR